MHQFLRKTERQTDTAREAMYRMYSTKEYMGQPEEGSKKALYEAAKLFFANKKHVGAVAAFKASLTESVKPEWLMWAVGPAINQLDHSRLQTGVGIRPVAPPWSKG